MITLVQGGLTVHHIRQKVDENGSQRPLTPSLFYFGPESAGHGSSTAKESLLKVPDFNRGISPASTVAYSSKVRGRETASAAPEENTAPIIKRARKSGTANSERNGATSRKVSGPTDVEPVNGNIVHQERNIPAEQPTTVTNGNHEDKMDVDHENTGEGDITMDEVEEALPPLIPTLTSGESKGIQVVPTKITNLLPNSAVLSIDSSGPLNQAVWQPNRSDILVAQSDSFCGRWNLQGKDLQSGSVKPLPSSIFPTDYTGLITAATWDQSGSVLAVATFSEEQGQIYLFEGDNLTLIETLPASQRAVTLLKWHSNGVNLIGISPDVDSGDEGLPGSTILCWNVSHGQEPTEPSVQSLPSSVLAFDLSGHAVEIFAAGTTAMFRCRYHGSHISLDENLKSPQNRPGDEWAFIKTHSSPHGRPSVVVAAAETATLWLPYHNVWEPQTHDGQITGLEVNSAFQHDDPNVLQFSTCSDDGTIKLWETGVDGITCLHSLKFEVPSPIMTLAYSHDGRYLAGAGYIRIQIWDTERDCRLIAQWNADKSEWHGANIQEEDVASRVSINGDGLAMVQHTLSWHGDNKRLALGLGSQIAVVNFHG